MYSFNAEAGRGQSFQLQMLRQGTSTSGFALAGFRM